MHTFQSELFDVTTVVLNQIRKIEVSSVHTAQDAMINLRIEFEELQARLRNRKIDGFEPAIESMLALGATSIAMAAALQAKILQQREQQMAREAEDAEDNVAETVRGYAKEERARRRTKLRSKKELATT